MEFVSFVLKLKEIMFNYKTTNKNSGFTIIEAMIAATVISIGLIGVLTLCTVSMKFGRISLNRVIAANLSQEGIEVIRSIRDNYWLDGKNPWDHEPPLPEKNPFRVNEDGIVFWDISSNNWTWDDSVSGYSDSARFYLDNGRYIQGTGSPQTNFYRIIEISADTDSDGYSFRRVISKVKWHEGNKFYEIQAEDWLYDWK